LSIINPEADDAKLYLESYQSFARSLRTWLIAYGIGAPVLFASQPAFSEMLRNKNAVAPVIYVFLAGMAVQIATSLLYKVTMWYIMWGALKPEFKQSKRYKFFNRLSELIWPELLLDVASIAAFTWATVKVLFLFTV